MTMPHRAALRYLGSKWRLAPWIVSHFPPHRGYVEPFCGAASVLLRKPRSNAECLNDLSDDIVNLFRVLRDAEQADELCRQLAFTPFARAEFEGAFKESADPVEKARRLVVRSYMGHGSGAATCGDPANTGFRASLGSRSGAGRGQSRMPAAQWIGMPSALSAVHKRLQGVLIEQRPASSLIERHDAEDVLFYVDPPYLPDLRTAKRRNGKIAHGYKHEMTPEEHVALLRQLSACRGSVVLSGYPCELYDSALEGWVRVSINTHADGALDRIEALWINPRAARRSDLFGSVA